MFDLKLAFAHTAGDQNFRIDLVAESRE